MTRQSPLRLLLALLAVFALFAAACGDDDDTSTDDDTTDEPSTDDTADDADADADDDADMDDDATVDDDVADDATDDDMGDDDMGLEGDLVGLFALDPGACTDGAVSGSYFRMVNPGGTVADGPFIENFDSGCADTTYSLLVAGSDGGLTPGSHQPAPDPAFDDAGNGLAAVIAEPVTFFGVDFAAATDPTLDAIVLTATAGVLSGQTTSFTAYYGGEPFNQGAPKADGSMPGITAAPTGTIDPATGAFVLEWSSQIVDGAFNDYTGVWHLEGTFSAT